jgi:coenzyme F420-0:L-glutamate ligase / coenzyme F420-1:gamma-L-glutamate ligase
VTLGTHIELIALQGMPLVRPGAELARLLAEAIGRAENTPRDGDVLVVAQKIVANAENRLVYLSTVRPSDDARRLARLVDKDPRLVEVMLSESKRVVSAERNVLITQHRLGFIMANAGVDRSNVVPESHECALMLPADPDQSAEALRADLCERFGVHLAVVINDSFGRPWRQGSVGVAIGAAGLSSLIDKRGSLDLIGFLLRVTVIAHADEFAAAASLVMGQADEGLPAVLIRGVARTAPSLPASALVRPVEEDLFL